MGLLRRIFKRREKPRLPKQQPRGKGRGRAARRPPAKETPGQAARRQSTSGEEFTNVPLKGGGFARVRRESVVKPGGIIEKTRPPEKKKPGEK